MENLIEQALSTPGGRIRFLRERKGMKQYELAARCDLSRASVSKIESDQKNPSMRSLLAIASALGASIDWIARGAGDPVCLN